MTWEETILHIRTNPQYRNLVEDAYLSEDIVDNVERYRKSKEFESLLQLIRKHKPVPDENLLVEIGAGNGIASLSFFLSGYKVIAVEPDLSETIGSGAIELLAKHYSAEEKIQVVNSFAESIPLADNSADIVFCRQALHHAHDLNKFISESARILKKGGIFIAIREHVLTTERDLPVFLSNHPLQKFYGGENAFTDEQYTQAIVQAGLKPEQTLKHFETPINYMPLDEKIFKAKMGALANFSFFRKLALRYIALKEKNKPGRLYTYIARK